jgi:NCS1 family nucleobase:cation symporter-1
MFFPPAGLGQGTRTHDEDQLVLPTAYRQDVPTQGQYSDTGTDETAGDVIVGEAVCQKSMSGSDPWDGDRKSGEKQAHP